MQEGTIAGPGGVPVYFRKYGNGHRGVVVPNAAWLARDLEVLTRDRTVVFYDPRGRGESGSLTDKSPVTLAGETEDLDLIRRHCGFDHIAILSWSYHGMVGANYAARNPDIVERLIVSGPMPPPYADQAAATMQSRLDMQAIQELMKSPPADPAAITEAWHTILMRGYFAAGGAYARGLPEPRRSANEQIGNVNRHYAAFLESVRDWDWRAAARQYPGPVLLLHGSGDFVPLEGSREWQSLFLNARLEVIPNAGHFIWLEQPELFFAAVNQFLDAGKLSNTAVR